MPCLLFSVLTTTSMSVVSPLSTLRDFGAFCLYVDSKSAFNSLYWKATASVNTVLMIVTCVDHAKYFWGKL